MKIHFKQAVHLEGKDYSRGSHPVPDKALKSKHFAKLLRLGWVSDPETVPVEVVTDQQRKERLAAKVSAQLKSPAKPIGPLETVHSAPPQDSELGMLESPQDEDEQHEEEESSDEFGEEHEEESEESEDAPEETKAQKKARLKAEKKARG